MRKKSIRFRVAIKRIAYPKNILPNLITATGSGCKVHYIDLNELSIRMESPQKRLQKTVQP